MKNIILKAITTITTILFILSCAAADSDSWIPMITAVICLAWLVPFVWVNREKIAA